MKKRLAHLCLNLAIGAITLSLSGCVSALTGALVGGASGLYNANKGQQTALSSSASKAKKSKKSQKHVEILPREQRLTLNDQRRYDYFFLEAVRLQNAEKFDAAFDLLRHCIQIDSLAPEPYFMLSLYYSELKNDSLTLDYLKKAETLNPQNDTYHERLAQYYLNHRNTAEAIEAYENLARSNTQRVDVLQLLNMLYAQSKRYGDLLQNIERIERIDGVSENTTLSKMQAYELKGDKESAYNMLVELSTKHPNDVNYKVMTGNWLMSNGRADEAYEIFQKAMEEEPDNEYVRNSMYDYYKSVGQDSMAMVLRDEILLSQKTATKTKMTMLQQVIRNNEKAGNDSTEVLTLFKKVVDANPKETDIAMLEAAYMTLKKLPVDSVGAVYAHILQLEPDKMEARLPLIQNAWEKEQWQEVIELCQFGTAYHPEEMVFYYYMGMAYYQFDDYDGALDAFTRGVDEITDKTDASLASDFYSLMGEMLHKKGNNSAAFEAFDKSLQWKADNLLCLNNYAYFLSVEGKDLQKAEQMSYKTVKAEPLNSTYLDTYAWILFMQERYAEARIYIDQAVMNMSEDEPNGVIKEHAGDIYYMSGAQEEALDWWKKAAEAGVDDAVLQRKIKQRKYIENGKKSQ